MRPRRTHPQVIRAPAVTVGARARRPERLFDSAADPVPSGSCPTSKLVAPFEPTGRPAAGDRAAVDGLGRGLHHQTLLGATGTGKTATLAWTIAEHQPADARPGPQQDARRAAVRRVPRVLPRTTRSSTSSATSTTTSPRRTCRAATRTSRRTRVRNDEIDRLRHAATHALFERRDVIIVASVSCIYGLGAPVDYGATVLRLRVGGQYRRDAVLRHLVDLQYQRNDQALDPRPVPRPRRHPRAPAGVRGDARPGRVLRRRGRADHRARSADRRAAGRAQGGQRLPGHPLRDAGRQAQGGDRRHRGRDGGAGRPARGRGPRPRRRPAPPADDVRPRDDARARLLHGRRELLAPPLAARGGLAAVDAARLLPAGLAARRRRVAHDHPAGGRHVQERPDPQGDPRRLRLPPAVRPRQPAADVRGVRGDRPPGRST